MKNKTATILLAGGLLVLAGAAFFIGTRLSQQNNVTPDDSNAAASCPSNLDAQISLDGTGNWQSSNQNVSIGQTVCVRAVPGTGTTISVLNSSNLVGKECTASPDGTVKCANTTDGICFKYSSWFGDKATVRALGYTSDTNWWEAIDNCIVSRKLSLVEAPTATPVPPTPTLAPGQTAVPTATAAPIVTTLPSTGVMDDAFGKYMIGLMFIILGFAAYRISKQKPA
jgi:hypothetical protein